MHEASDSWPERIDPEDTVPGVVAYHLAKYAFALRHISGTVIDVACGVGYGTEFLGPHVKRAIGVEIADDAIAIARRRYRHDNIWFVRSNAERLPFPGLSADAVTCFEGIEHFANPESHLDEVVRVLRAGGVYIVSTPHPDAHPHGEDNPYHLHEFEPEVFEKLLRSRFPEVTVFGQRRVQTEAHRTAQRMDVLGLRKIAFLRPLTKRFSRSALMTTPNDEATLDDFVIEPFNDVASEYVAVCRTDAT
jgi:SAM-dependent methyltransferase